MHQIEVNPIVIVLNGTSSSGKTSIAKALQRMLPVPFLHVCIDAFEEMSPGRTEEGGDFATSVALPKLISGMHHSIAALAYAGNNLIVDHVIIEGDEPSNWLSECLECVAPFRTIFVGVRCSFDELNRRERSRGDRPLGLAEWQITRMHIDFQPDLEFDTTMSASEECATQIAEFVRHRFDLISQPNPASH